MAEPRIRVLCVEDHGVVREGIRLTIDMEPDMEVAAVAATGEEGLDLFREYRPDVVLMDLQLPGISGLDTIRAIRRFDPEARIVVLTMYDGDEDIFRALEAGAATYLLKESLSDELIGVVRQVHGGERPLPPEVAARLAGRVTQPALTAREIQVVDLIAKGLRNKEIGATLEISEGTVQAHIKRIFTKLNVHDRAEAVTVALRRGIIHLR